MSTSASPNSEPVTARPPAGPEAAAAGRARRALVLSFSLAALAVAAAFLLLGRGEPPTADLRLASWRPAPEALAAQAARDRELAETLTWGPPEDEVAAALAAYDRVEMEVGADPQSARLREAQADLQRALRRYAGAYGVKRYHALGLHLRQRFEAALGAVLEGVRQSGEQPRAWLDRRPLSPEVEAYRRWCGGFLEQALANGLVRPDGTLPEGGAHLPGLFFLVRWFHWIHPVTDYTFQLSDTELHAFWAWKVEQSERLPLARRFELVEQLRRVRPDYPAAWVRGVLHAREERWAEAAAEWERWLAEHPEDERARENLAFARELLGNQARLAE